MGITNKFVVVVEKNKKNKKNKQTQPTHGTVPESNPGPICGKRAILNS